MSGQREPAGVTHTPAPGAGAAAGAAVDVLIIGAGIAGLSCAWALVQAGATVRVVSAAPYLGDGASGTPTGILVPPHPRRAATPFGMLAAQSVAQYPAWLAALEAAAEAPVPFWPLDARRGDAVRPAAHLVPPVLLMRLAEAITRRGGTIAHAPVARLVHASQRVTGVQTVAGDTLGAGHVLVAAGLASRALVAPLGIDLPLTGDAGQVLEVYVPQVPDHIILSGRMTIVPKERSVWVTGIHRAGDAHAITASDRDRLLAAAGIVLHTRYVNAIGCEWAGVRPRAAGGVPLLGALPGWSGVSVACGHGANGYLLAPVTGERLVTAVGTHGMLGTTTMFGMYQDNHYVNHYKL